MQNDLARIENYLRGKMTKQEKALFEKDIQTDPQLKKTAITYLLGVSAESESADELIRIWQQESPLPTPEISFADRLRYLWYENKSWIWPAAAGLALIVAAVFLFSTPRPSPNLISQYFLQPDCGTIAGVQESPDLDMKKKAADLYCGVTPGGTEALTALAGSDNPFNIAHFYLAHDYLRNGDYDNAGNELEKCVQHGDEINRYDSGYLQMAEFNRILASLGQGASANELRGAVAAYRAKYPGHTKAAEFENELKNRFSRLSGN